MNKREVGGSGYGGDSSASVRDEGMEPIKTATGGKKPKQEQGAGSFGAGFAAAGLITDEGVAEKIKKPRKKGEPYYR